MTGGGVCTYEAADNYGLGAQCPVRSCDWATFIRQVLITLHSQLHRHRRRALTALAVLAVALVALTAHSALMGGMDDHMVSDAAALCLAVGGSLAVAGVAAFGIRRLAQRPLWLMPAPATPALPFVPASTGLLVRAGPPPLLQVFRL